MATDRMAPIFSGSPCCAPAEIRSAAEHHRPRLGIAEENLTKNWGKSEFSRRAAKGSELSGVAQRLSLLYCAIPGRSQTGVRSTLLCDDVLGKESSPWHVSEQAARLQQGPGRYCCQPKGASARHASPLGDLLRASSSPKTGTLASPTSIARAFQSCRCLPKLCAQAQVDGDGSCARGMPHPVPALQTQLTVQQPHAAAGFAFVFGEELILHRNKVAGFGGYKPSTFGPVSMTKEPTAHA